MFNNTFSVCAISRRQKLRANFSDLKRRKINIKPFFAYVLKMQIWKAVL